MKYTGDSWDTLVLRIGSITRDSTQKLIEGFWPKVVTRLAELKDIDIAGPSDEAWFHVRRAISSETMEVLRLKTGILTARDVESIRLLAETESAIGQADWCPESFDARHDNAFLSFLQKLSVLRAGDGVCYSRFIAGTPKADYDMDAGCQEAYRVMMCPTGPWYRPLSPWFDYMTSTHMDSYRTHEYAHWFGHIVSGWD